MAASRLAFLAVVAALLSKAEGVRLRRVNASSEASGAQAEEPPEDNLRKKAKAQVYTLQFVGLASNGIEPRAVQDKEANRCLKVIGPDQTGKGGVGLSFAGCAHFSQKDKFGIPTGTVKQPSEDQLFQFREDGKMQSFQNGLCVRRIRCAPSDAPPPPGDRLWLYDLGPCHANDAVKFEIQKSRANRAALLVPSGDLLSVVSNSCTTCGPFMLQQVCKGSCDNTAVHVGWTKPQTAVIPPKTLEDEKRIFKNPAPYMAGLCGSFLSEDENANPWWYFSKYDAPGPPPYEQPPAEEEEEGEE